MIHIVGFLLIAPTLLTKVQGQVKICGDGHLEGNEQCDDSNLMNGDG